MRVKIKRPCLFRIDLIIAMRTFKSSIILVTAFFLGIFANCATVYSNELSHQTVADELLTGYPVGFKILKERWKGQRRRPYALEIAVWYPSSGEKTKYRYPFGENKMTTSLALNGKPVIGKFPLIVYAHGATGGGTSSAFITETLARKGYIVVAVDYTDRFSQVRISKPVALRKFKKIRMLKWAKDLRSRQFGAEAQKYRKLFGYRPDQTKLTVDRMLRENSDKTSLFYRMINESRIGIVGHSFGAWTSMMVGGADPAYRDPRIKVIVAMSGPVTRQVYNVHKPREVNDIHVPIMFMYGQKEPLVGRPSDKEFLFDLANQPRFLLSVEDADHFTFSGGVRKEFETIDDFLRLDRRRAVLTYYIRYFFDYYLKGQQEAKAPLTRNIRGVDRYLKDFGE
ncbi:hypothetical protein MNBD_NITROSPINAE04-2686 [hydrothermal vent metagenome]|uniref:Uncharacterized protein n=1 Tax=hydrothermal vent metagenome TaxID=652676 RepID=A0A3B1CGG0_9ZZZZ